MAFLPRLFSDDSGEGMWDNANHHMSPNHLGDGLRPGESAWESPLGTQGPSPQCNRLSTQDDFGGAFLPAAPSPGLNPDFMGPRTSAYTEAARSQFHRAFSPSSWLHPDRSFLRQDEQQMTHTRTCQEHYASPRYMPLGYTPDSSHRSSWSVASGHRETSPIDTNASAFGSCPSGVAPNLLMGNLYAGLGAQHSPSFTGGCLSTGHHQSSSFDYSSIQHVPGAQDLQMGKCIAMSDIQFSPDPSQADDHTFNGEEAISPSGARTTLDESPSNASANPDMDAEGEPDEDYKNEDLSDSLPITDYAESDGSDLDFSPTHSARKGTARRVQARRPRRNSKAITSSPATVTGRVSKSSAGGGRGGVRAGKARSNLKGKAEEVVSKAIAQGRNPQPFTCPMVPYGCGQTFTTKNEWKRHIVSLHLFIGLWRCNLCPDMASRPNDFNRKDLFVQHLRRMHFRDESSPESNKAGKKKNSTWRHGKQAVPKGSLAAGSSTATGPSTEELEEICARCWHQLREEPTHTQCAFCSRQFLGKNSLEEWLEHVARHLSGSAEQRQPVAANLSPSTAVSFNATSENLNVDCSPERWADDHVFLDWLVRNDLVKRGSDQQWIMKDKETVLVDAQRFLSEKGLADQRRAFLVGEDNLHLKVEDVDGIKEEGDET